MPTISRFFGILIRMYYSEQHGVAHFHAKYAEHEAVFSIRGLKLIAGGLPKAQQKLVEAWAFIHRDELMENADRLADGYAPRKIQPLR